MDGVTKNMTESIGSEWRKTGGSRRKICSPDIVEIYS